jgi:hypothetical protein
MPVDFIAQLRHHQDPIAAPAGHVPVQIVAFDNGQTSFPLIFNLISRVDLPPDGWSPHNGWQFQMWKISLPMAVTADREGAVFATTRGLKGKPPFLPAGFMVWIDQRLFQVDHATARNAQEPLSRRHVMDVTPPVDRRQTYGQRVIREMEAVREIWDLGRVEESRLRMSKVMHEYEEYIGDPAGKIAPLSIIERIDFENGGLALRAAYDKLKLDWDQRPPQWQ